MKTLNDLVKAKALILPGPSGWSQPFSSMDKFYEGDLSTLIFKMATKGNSDNDKDNIILTCTYLENEVVARIRNINNTINKERLIDRLNKLAGKSIIEVFSSPLI